MRLFLAIDVPEAVRSELAEHAANLPGAPGGIWPKAKFVRAASMHVTLAFLGELDPAFVELIDEALGPVFSKRLAMTGQVGTPGAFPPRGKARVLWAGLAVDGDLVGLRRDAELALGAIPGEDGPIYVPEARPFHPHVTIARCRQPWPRSVVDPWLESFGDPGLAIPIDHGTLFESELTTAGARYRAVSTYPLRGSDHMKEEEAVA